MTVSNSQNPGPEGHVLGRNALARETLLAANVNPKTGLATDYLNHFNEVVMLMEMLPDMPDCAEDVLDWAPCDYCSHFEKSGLKDIDVVILAYNAVPREIKAHFETLILQIDSAVVQAQSLLRGEVTDEITQQVAHLASEDIKPLIVAASGAINGSEESEEDYVDESVQAEVDALFD